jgi:hypothetical protein
MNHSVGPRLVPSIAFLLWLWLALGCSLFSMYSPAPQSREVVPMTASGIVIRHNIMLHRQGEFKDLEIGTGNFFDQEYVDDLGMARKGLTAGLFLMISKKTATYRTFTVYAGQTVRFEEYEIQILRLENDAEGGFLEVEIRSAKTPENG